VPLDTVNNFLIYHNGHKHKDNPAAHSDIPANLLLLLSTNTSIRMASQNLLTIAQTAELLNCSAGFVRKRISLTESRQPTIAQTAELLNCSAGFVRKRISLTESRQPGGWPKHTYVNLQPNGAKSLFRVDKDALQEFLKSQAQTESVETQEAKVEEESTCSTGTCPF